MKKNSFFKTTPLYKEYMILDLLEKDPNVTQRSLSDMVGASVSMINAYIDEYEKNGYLKRNYISNKTVEYLITKKGIERRKLLNISYLKASHSIYLSAKKNILIFLEQIIEKGYKDILLYGAGEVAELLLQVISVDVKIPLNIIAVIDDDINKHNTRLVNYQIIGSHEISEIKHDGILISSYTHRERIYNNLKNLEYSKEKILMFFEI